MTPPKKQSHQADDPPLVTIGMPVFISAEYVAGALDSLVGQTYPNLEIVISDNASTDGTERICREYATGDARVRYLREEQNRGAIWNFNRLVTLARGDFFKWAAGDDICDPTFVARCVEVLTDDPTIVCCHSRTGVIDSSDRRLLHRPDPTRSGGDGSSPHPHKRFLDVLRTDGYSARSYGVMHTETLRGCAPLMTVYGSEKVLMGELALLGRFHDIEEVLFYERHDSAVSPGPATLKEQLELVKPGKRALPLSPRLSLLAGHLGAIRRSRLGLKERTRCHVAIVRYLFQVRKWGPVAKSLFMGTGTRR